MKAALLLVIILYSSVIVVQSELGTRDRRSGINDKSETFLIYRYLSATRGFCLTAERKVKDHKEVFETLLTTSCSVNSTAWRWIKLEGNLFKNLKFDRCLTAVPGESGGLSGELSVSPCDSDDQFQKWSCDFSCNVFLQHGPHSILYRLEHQLTLAEWTVTGGKPMLRLNDGASRNATADSLRRWIIYDYNFGGKPRCICDANSKKEASESAIVTTIGGNVVGKHCVFPFIFNGREVWNCIRHENGLQICSTARNLDRNPEKWGVCPENKRGTLSEWLAPAMCDKACGGGRLFKRRKCLFQPCSDALIGVQVDETCNNQKCTGDRVLTVGGNSDQFPAEGVMALLNDRIVGKCKFPFIVDQEETETCLSDFRRRKPWCSLTDNFDKHQKWGFCVNETKGIWTSWKSASKTHNSCTRTCGGGRLMQIRVCHQPPCEGETQRAGGTCNTKPCPGCYHEKGGGYRGLKNVANDGSTCQSWDVHAPHSHPDLTRNVFPELESNYCRNPGERLHQPFCYRNKDGEPAQMYCDLYPCETNLDLPGIPYTIPASITDETAGPVPCIFPYMYDSEWFDTCLLLEEQQPGREKCAVSSGENVNVRYCPSYFRGTWSEWRYAGECTRKCGGGFQVSFRRCYLVPCVGDAVRVDESKPCNTYPCTWTQPGSEHCFTGRGLLYKGTTSTSVSGRPCQAWNDSSVHPLRIHNNMLPVGIPRLVDNHCRNPTPGVYHGPWCYIKPQAGRHWEYCDIPRCPTKEGEIYGLAYHNTRLAHSDKPCMFPFFGADKKWHSNCAVVNPYSTKDNMRYCAFSIPEGREQPLADTLPTPATRPGPARVGGALRLRRIMIRGFQLGTYGVCPPSTGGTWSTWTITGRCSVKCGGGKVVIRHRCLHPPCVEQRPKHDDQSQPCNTQKCHNCLSGNGETYRGNVTTSYIRVRCRDWQATGVSQFTSTNYPYLTRNYCRNPGGVRTIPWCWRTVGYRHGYCEVPHCNDDNMQTISYTMPFHKYSRTAAACHFPYRDIHWDWYYSCFEIPEGDGEMVCPLKESIEHISASDLGICPTIYRGRWTDWNRTSTCSKMCGGGDKMFVRECLYPPCTGKKYKFEGSCNTHNCGWENRLVENVDCFIDEGIAYEGTVSHTITGYACLPWGSKQHNHNYRTNGVGVDLGSAACRNPSPVGFRMAPWCFVQSFHRRWEYCNIPRCPAHEGEIRSVSGPSDNKPCHFPFLSQGSSHGSCLELPRNAERGGARESSGTMYFCATVGDSDQHPSKTDDVDWGFCPVAYQGTLGPWSLWPGDRRCSEPCGGGKLHYFRRCRFLHCAPNQQLDKHEGNCNTQPCESRCYTGDGSTYRGNDFRFQSRLKCDSWYLAKTNGPRHSYCRNTPPSDYKMPHCYGKLYGHRSGYVMCDMPRCDPNEDKLVTVGWARDGGGRECVFPFKVANVLVHSCQPMESNAKFYCGTAVGDSDVLAEDKYGFCSQYSIGTWSAWGTTDKCSAVCGGGHVIITRHCRYNPCKGPHNRKGGVCNTHACDSRNVCYDARNGGSGFRSGEQRFIEGKNCVPWERQEMRGQSGINCITDPSVPLSRPFCLREVSHNRYTFAYCNVAFCPGTVAGPIMVSPPVKRYDPPPLVPCIFPFEYRNKTYDHCTNDPGPLGVELPSPYTRWCGTARDVNLAEHEYGFCPLKYGGAWSDWSSGSAMQCTSACVFHQTRQCLYPDCSGSGWKISAKLCKGANLCRSPVWTAWDQWTKCESCYRVKTRVRRCVAAQTSIAEARTQRKPHCRGHPTQAEPCEDGVRHLGGPSLCDEADVYGQITQTDVNELTAAYSKLKFLGSSAKSYIRADLRFLTLMYLTTCAIDF